MKDLSIYWGRSLFQFQVTHLSDGHRNEEAVLDPEWSGVHPVVNDHFSLLMNNQRNFLFFNLNFFNLNFFIYIFLINFF